MSDSNKKIFLSYASEDIFFARKLFKDLSNYQLNVWFDKKKLLPGHNWQLEIESAIKSSNYFVILLSKNSLSKRGYVQKEVKIALEILDYFPEKSIFVIPVRISNCKVDISRFQKLQWIDLFPAKLYRAGISKIIEVIGTNKTKLRKNTSSVFFCLKEEDLIKSIRKNNFYDAVYNHTSHGSTSKFLRENINGVEVLIDEKTGLMWQKGGSSDLTEYRIVEKTKKGYNVVPIPGMTMWTEINAEKYLTEVNSSHYAGFNDWRIPTVQEVMSLCKKRLNKSKLHICSKFDQTKFSILTSDLTQNDRTHWSVNFLNGSVYDNHFKLTVFLKVVRTIQ